MNTGEITFACTMWKIIVRKQIEESWKDPHKRKQYDCPICAKNCINVLIMNAGGKSFDFPNVKNLFVRKKWVMKGPTQKKTIWLSHMWQGFHQCFKGWIQERSHLAVPCERSFCQKKMRSHERTHTGENHMTTPYVTRIASMF